MAVAGHIQLQCHICQSVVHGQLDILAVVDGLACCAAAAPAVGPGAIGGELEFVGGACAHVLEGDLVDIVTDFRHGVGGAGNIPVFAVEPGAGAVAHGDHGGDLQTGLLSNMVTGNGDGAVGGIEGDGDVTDGGDNEGVVVAVVAPVPIPGAVGDLQVVGACGHVCVDLLIGAVGGQGHPVGSIIGSPIGAAEGGVAGHDVQFFLHIAALGGGGNRGGSGGGLLRFFLHTVGRPGAAAIVPAAVGHGVQIGAVGGNRQIGGLVPLVGPVVGFCVGIHAAEDDVAVACGNGALVDAVVLGGQQIIPVTFAVIPVINSEPGPIHQPVGIGLEVQRGVLRSAGVGHGDHAQQQDEAEHQAQDPSEKRNG